MVGVKTRSVYGITVTIKHATVLTWKVKAALADCDYTLKYTNPVFKTIAAFWKADVAKSIPEKDSNSGIKCHTFVLCRNRANIQIYATARNGNCYNLRYEYMDTDIEHMAFDMYIEEQNIQSKKAMPKYQVGDIRYDKYYQEQKYKEYEVVDVLIKNNRVSYQVKCNGAVKEINEYDMDFKITEKEMLQKEAAEKRYQQRVAQINQERVSFNEEVEFLAYDKKDFYITNARFAHFSKGNTLNEYIVGVTSGLFDERHVCVVGKMELTKKHWDFAVENLMEINCFANTPQSFNKMTDSEMALYDATVFDCVVELVHIETGQSCYISQQGYDYPRCVGLPINRSVGFEYNKSLHLN